MRSLVMVGWAAKLTAWAIGLPSASSTRSTRNSRSTGLSSRFEWRLRLNGTSLEAMPSRAGFSAVRFKDEISEFCFELADIGLLGIGPVVQLQDRAVVGVRADEEDVLDAGIFDAGPYGSGRLAGGAVPQVEADDGDLLVPAASTSAGLQGIEDALARLIVARPVAPHGVAGGWRDLDLGVPALRVSARAGRARRQKRIPKYQRITTSAVPRHGGRRLDGHWARKAQPAGCQVLPLSCASGRQSTARRNPVWRHEG